MRKIPNKIKGLGDKLKYTLEMFMNDYKGFY